MINKITSRRFKLFILGSMAALLIIIWLTKPDDKLRLIFCDVGQGDGIMITKNYFQMIVDTGPKNNKMIECIGRYLPFWDKRIEMVLVTHEDQDHSGGLKLVTNYFRTIDIIRDLKKGDLLRWGGIEFLVLSPDMDWGEDNKNSLVGVLTYEGKKVLLMADVPAEVEQRLVWREEIGSVDILKVSHHGSRAGTSEELLKMIKPAEAVISTGKNKFGHPTKEVLERLAKYGARIRRTDEEGDVVYVF